MAEGKDSDNKTPATNAPIAMDNPPNSINKAAPSTTNNAAAVITSRALACAKIRNNGLSNHRPMATNAPKDKAEIPTRCHSGEVGSWAISVGDIKATIASKGTIRRSSNNKMETMR
jgi:hypothetical protein